MQNDAPAGFNEQIGRIARAIAAAGQPGRMNMGDAAALRRLDPDHIAGRHLLALARVLPDSARLDDAEQTTRWAAIVNAIALARGAHDPAMPPGKAMSLLGLTENRVASLLSADAATLRELVARLARRAAAAGQALDWRPLARLLIDAGTGREDAAERIRLRIAGDFTTAERAAAAPQTP